MKSNISTNLMVHHINAKEGNYRKLVHDFYYGNYFSLLGFPTLVACIVELMPKIGIYGFYRILAAAKVEKNINSKLILGEIKDATLRELSRLPSQQQKTVWEQAKKIAPPGRKYPTAKLVKDLVDSWLIKAEQKAQHSSYREVSSFDFF